MIPVAGRPILDWIIRWLIRNGISHIVVGVAYKKESVREHVHKLGVDAEFDFSELTVEGGTGEDFRLAIERFDGDNVFVAMNDDEITDINIEDFADFHVCGGVATVGVANLRSPFGVVEINGDDIVDFKEKAFLNAYVSTGVYMFDHRILEFLPVRGNMENDTFPKLARQGQLRAYKHKGFWGTIDTLKDLQEVEKELMKGIPNSRRNPNSG
jgi:NDP-sugar pyrophosphorylase family protein